MSYEFQIQPMKTTTGREFGEFVTALLTLLDRNLITTAEARRALSDWGMQLDSPVRNPAEVARERMGTPSQ